MNLSIKTLLSCALAVATFLALNTYLSKTDSTASVSYILVCKECEGK